MGTEATLELLSRLVLNSKWPMLEFDDGAMKQIKNLSDMRDRQLLEDPTTSAVWAEVFKELTQRLDYLNGYGGDTYRVSLTQDWGTPCSFLLLWKRRSSVPGGPEWLPIFNGGLQFDGAPGPFPSIVIGERTFWSINT